jgi:hypothetical protein
MGPLPARVMVCAQRGITVRLSPRHRHKCLVRRAALVSLEWRRVFVPEVVMRATSAPRRVRPHISTCVERILYIVLVVVALPCQFNTIITAQAGINSLG